jgi:SLT domain-containing protein
VDYGSGTPVKATISNMKVQAPGKYTFASNNPQTAELSYLQFIQCTSSGQVENVQVLGSSDSQLASHVTNNIQKGVNGVASKLCKYINSKLIKKVPIEIDI